MKLSDKQLQQVLLGGNYVEEKDLASAIKNSEARHISLASYLVAEEILTPDLLGQAIAEFYKLAYADLNSNQPSKEQIAKIPELIAQKFRLILFKEGVKDVVITTDAPDNINLIDKIKILFPKKKFL